MKKVIIASLAVCAVMLSGCTLGPAQKIEKIDLSNLENQLASVSTDIKAIREVVEKQVSQVATPVSSTTVVKTEDPAIAYQKFGFDLTLPDKGVLVEKGDGPIGRYITNFYYSDEKNTDVFAISVYTYEQWKRVQNQAGPKPTKLADNGNYIYGVSFSQTVPSDYAKPILKSFITIQ